MTGRATAATLLGAVALTLAFGGDTVAGYASTDVAAALSYGAALLWLTGWAVRWGRPTVAAALGAIVMWSVFVVGATSLFVHRDAALAGLRAAVEDAGYGPPTASVTGSGEIAVTRRRDGTFLIPVTVNGRLLNFMFDTGASLVVVKAETATELGFDVDTLSFRSRVLTANGATLAAPVTLDRLAIGPITMTRVQALVAKRGTLHENLLGQNVLDRLESYEVRANRLVLRAGKG